MRPSSPRTALVALALSAGLGAGAAACTRAEDPATPATSISPDSSTKAPDANTVPPGVSGQGSQGGEGQGQAKP